MEREEEGRATVSTHDFASLCYSPSSCRFPASCSVPAKQLHCSALQAGPHLCVQLPGRESGEGHAGTCPSVLLQRLDLTQLPTQDKRQLLFKMSRCPAEKPFSLFPLFCLCQDTKCRCI